MLALHVQRPVKCRSHAIEKGRTMNARELVANGLPQECVGIAFDSLKASGLIANPVEAMRRIVEIAERPDGFAGDPHFGALATAVLALRTQMEEAKESWGRNPHGVPAGFAQWSERDDPGSIQQMSAACELPVAVQGALMPDNHLGYGLPIGGVLGRHRLPHDVHDH
jgi:tRNA-splicing ligase RtcB